MALRMVVPNVLASRYASKELTALWSPTEKIILERRLWLAVLKAQKDLGIAVPDGAIEAYERVLQQVDLDSIAKRERVTRHDARDAALIGDILFAAEEIARLEPLLEQRLAHFSNQLR